MLGQHGLGFRAEPRIRIHFALCQNDNGVEEWLFGHPPFFVPSDRLPATAEHFTDFRPLEVHFCAPAREGVNHLFHPPGV